MAFQEAYLKAHYPVPFMAALMSNEMSDTDAIVVLINECRKTDIKVLPPDINKSDKVFTVEGESIRFGLCAIKNVGHGAVESIVKARKEYGEFSDIFDLCDNIDLRLANKRVLESLTQAGAVDSLEGHRAQNLDVIDIAIDAAQSRQRDRDKGQTSLFDLNGDDDDEPIMIHKPVLPAVPKWPASQTLALEKDLLGFYVTGHPLAEFEDDLRAFATAEMRRLDRVSDREEDVVVGGIVTAIKPIVDRKGQSMAFVTLEDFSGAGEILVFSDQYELHKTLVAADSLILVRGQISAKEGENKVVASEIMSLPEARDKLTRSVVVTVTPEQTTDDIIGSLKETFKTHPGDCEVRFKIPTREYGEVSIKAGGHIRVAPTTELLLVVREMLGANRARLAGASIRSSNSGWTVINDVNGRGRGRGRNGNGRWNSNGDGYGE